MYNNIGNNIISTVKFINNNGETPLGTIKIYNNMFNIHNYSSGFINTRHEIIFDQNHPIRQEYNTTTSVYSWLPTTFNDSDDSDEYKIDNLLYKQLDDNEICPITTTKIPKNGYYEKCNSCNNIFSHESLQKWLKSYVSKKSCPLCRSPWDMNDNKVYVNSSIYELSDDSDENKN